ncbi:MAG: BrnA antitoxin family protein [Candidatus Protistobacter heckmanni]|nr:BrnA antitoxin family protein [Candidatus Protistobacter heckmanni]
MKAKTKLVKNTPSGDAAVQRGIAVDPDAMEVSADDFRRMKPLGKRGRPPAENPKVLLTVRYDKDVVDAFKAGGDGWQTRMNAALREWLREHSVS